MGTVIVTRAAVSLGLCDASELQEVIDMLKSASLPTECPFSADELTEISLRDKKRFGNTITLVVPYSIGDSRLYKINVTELKDFIKRGLDK